MRKKFKKGQLVKTTVDSQKEAYSNLGSPCFGIRFPKGSVFKVADPERDSDGDIKVYFSKLNEFDNAWDYQKEEQLTFPTPEEKKSWK